MRYKTPLEARTGPLFLSVGRDALPKSPGHVLTNERRGILSAACQGLNDQRSLRPLTERGQRIAHADREVAQPSFIADAVYGAAREPLVEFRLGPREKLDQCGAVQPIANGEIHLLADLREPVPGTRELAVIAAVDAVAYERRSASGIGPLCSIVR